LVGSRSRIYERDFVNNARLSSEHRLRNGDEIRFGSSRLVFRLRNAPVSSVTAAAEPAPHVTRREREVLVALCRPLLDGDMFTEAAAVTAIAADLVVTEAAVKFHLGNLYDKFRIADDGDGARRSRLANEAIRRRALTLSDLRRVP
jgi:DNA-binding NarL/FixJ family response regulator